MAKVRVPNTKGGPPKPPTIPELAERGRRYRGEKPLREALREALRDLFDAYLYTLTHPCEVSPHEVLALIHAHREVLTAHFEFESAELRAQRRQSGQSGTPFTDWEALKSLLGAGSPGEKGPTGGL
jgi:hypothetical protein